MLYDETAMGASPLSSDNLLPTDLGVLTMGRNRVTGVISRAFITRDVDVFQFEVPTGFVFDGVFVIDYRYTSPPMPNEANAFLGINNEDTFPYDVEGLDINNNFDFDQNLFLGGSLFGISDVPTNNILQRIGNVTGRMFTAPLPADTYTVYIQQTGPENRYTLDFAVSAVPEPAHVSLAAIAMVGIAAYRRRRRKKLIAL